MRHVLALSLCLGAAPLTAQQVEQTVTWEQDQEIDLFMGTLRDPVWQPVWFTLEDRVGMPLIPLYKQQPAGAQGDFRPSPPTPSLVFDPDTGGVAEPVVDSGSEGGPVPTPDGEPEAETDGSKPMPGEKPDEEEMKPKPGDK